MRTLLRKTKAYAGRHSDDSRAPTGTPCSFCGEKQLGVPERMLARCSVCEVWLCVGECFSLHRAPKGYGEDTLAPWWKRVIGRG